MNNQIDPDDFANKFPGWIFLEETHLMDNYDDKLIHDYLIRYSSGDQFRIIICYYNTRRYSIRICLNGSEIYSQHKIPLPDFERNVKEHTYMKPSFHRFKGKVNFTQFENENFNWDFLYGMFNYLYMSRPAHTNYIKKKIIEL